MKGLKAYYMKGMLSFFVLWLLSKRPMDGQAIAREIAKKRGKKMSPGTIYPALKELEKRKLISRRDEGRLVVYRLTKQGRKSLRKSIAYFKRAFGEILKG